MRGVVRFVRPWLLFPLLVLPLAAPRAGRGEEPVRETEEIVVEDERLRPAEVFEDTAIETEVIEREKVEALPARDVSDIVGRLPGIRTQQRVQGEDAAVSIEGMPPEYTKILVNGARYTGAIDGVADLADIPTHNIERIEVLRGNQGVRYGTDAAGGVINVLTRQAPEEGVRFDLDGGAGEDGQLKSFGTTGFHLGRLGVTVTGGHYEIDGYDAPPESERFTVSQAGTEDSERLERHFYGTFDYPLSPQLDLYARVGWRREDWDFAQDDLETTGNVDPENAAVFEGSGSSNLQRDFETWTSTAGFRFSPGEATTLSGDVNYFTGTTDSEIGREFTQDEDQYQVNLSGEHLLETGPISHALLAALDWRRSSLALVNGPLPPGLDPSEIRGGDVDKWFYQTGLYLETESAFTEWASLVLGLRLQAHSQFDEALLPQVALLLRPHESTKLRFSWGENQRTPSLRDLYQPDSPQLGGSYFLAGNPELQPESSESWRASVEWSPHRVASFAVVGFWNDFDDSIRAVLARNITVGSNTAGGTGSLPPDVLLDFFELCSDSLVNFRLIGCDVFTGGTGAGVVTGVTAPVYEKVNLDSVRTRGVEVRLNLRPYEPLRLELELGYTLLDTEVRDSDRPELRELPNEPKHVVDARIYFTLPRAGTAFALVASWRDRAVIETSGTGLLGFSDPSTLSDPAFLLDVRIAQPLPRWPHVEVYLDAINLTNTRIIDSYAIRGRTFFVGIRASFNPTSLPSWANLGFGRKDRS
jgi:outer membrane receptor for ferrienterochelin and colicins